jgi:hypothetical protein
LDTRSSKIAHLEAQLRDILYSTIKIPVEKKEEVGVEDGIILEHGQNLMELHIDAAVFSPEGLAIIKKLGMETLDDGSINQNFSTFIHFSFFEFETQITPLGLGLKPHYNHTARFKVFVDDFFLQYLQSQAMGLNFCRSNGLDYYAFGKW